MVCFTIHPINFITLSITLRHYYIIIHSAFCIHNSEFDKSLAMSRNVVYNVAMTNLELMRISENADEDAFEQDDFPQRRKSAKDAYDEFYDDVKQPSRYIKEDW